MSTSTTTHSQTRRALPAKARIDGKITEEIGLDDGVTALTQLGLMKAVAAVGDA
jgi:hypothetical protein